MLTVEDYGRIRRAHGDGISIRAIGRMFDHSRREICQVLAEPRPRPYTLAERRAAPKLGTFRGIIDEILAEDEQAPRKQPAAAGRPSCTVGCRRRRAMAGDPTRLHERPACFQRGGRAGGRACPDVLS